MRTILGVLVTCFCCLMSVTFCGAQQSGAGASQIDKSPLEKAVLDVIRDNRTGSYSSVKLVKQAISRFPSSDPFLAKALFMVGNMEYGIGKYDEALQDLDRCLATKAPFKGIHISAAFTRMQCFRALGRHKEALGAAEALAKLPQVKAYSALISAANRIRYEEWMAVARKSGKKSDIQSALIAVRKVKDSTRAMSSQAEADEYRAALYSEFNFLRGIGQSEQAMLCLEDFIKTHPNDTNAASYALDVELIRKHTDLINIHPEDIDWIRFKHPVDTNSGIRVLYQIAFSHARYGKYAKAVELAKVVYNYDPGTNTTGYNLNSRFDAGKLIMLSLYDQKKKADAIEMGRELLRRFPTNPEIGDVRAQLELWGAEPHLTTAGRPIIAILCVVGIGALVVIVYFVRSRR